MSVPLCPAIRCNEGESFVRKPSSAVRLVLSPCVAVQDARCGDNLCNATTEEARALEAVSRCCFSAASAPHTAPSCTDELTTKYLSLASVLLPASAQGSAIGRSISAYNPMRLTAKTRRPWTDPYTGCGSLMETLAFAAAFEPSGIRTACKLLESVAYTSSHRTPSAESKTEKAFAGYSQSISANRNSSAAPSSSTRSPC